MPRRGPGQAEAAKRRQEEATRAALLARYSATPPATIPRQGQQPKQGVPYPQTAPAPVPVVSQQVRAQRDVGFDVQRQPTPQPNIYQKIAGFFSNIRGPGYDFLPGARETLAEIYRPRGLTDIFGENVALTLGREQRNLATQAHPSLRLPAPPYIKKQRTFGARRYSAALASLYQGVRPPFLGFGIQEFMGLTDQEMIDDLGYAKVPGGWVMRPVLDQPLENVYGSGTAAQPQTINVNYGGYGGGGGATRQQSSYLVNWRI